MDKRIGAQLYTLREFCQTAEDFDDTLKKVSEIGYKIIQVSGIGPISAADIKKSADKYGLKICCTHKGPDDFKPENLENTIAFHKEIGCDIAGICSMPPEYRESDDGFKKFIKDYSAAAEILYKEGIRFGYHNHAIEFKKYEGKHIFYRLAEETDPDKFTFIFDTYWAAFAGMNVTEVMEKLKGRISVAHYKDLQVVSFLETGMCEVGEGNLAWEKIIKASEETGIEYAVVEQDVCKRDPFESLKMSFDYLTKKGFE